MASELARRDVEAARRAPAAAPRASADAMSGHDLAAGRLELGDERRRRRRPPRRGSSASRPRGRTSPRTSPNEALSGRSRRSIAWADDPGEQRPRGLVARTVRGRGPRPTAAPGSPNRASASGCRGRWTTGRSSSAADLVRVADERPEEAPPGPAIRAAEPARRGGHRSLEDDGPAAVERMGDRGVRVDELDAAGGEVDRPEERRGERQRQDRRADVVAEPGEGQLRGPRPAAGLGRGLVDADRAPGTGQGDRGGEAVRPGPDDDRVDLPPPDRIASRRSFVSKPERGRIGSSAMMAALVSSSAGACLDRAGRGGVRAKRSDGQFGVRPARLKRRSTTAGAATSGLNSAAQPESKPRPRLIPTNERFKIDWRMRFTPEDREQMTVRPPYRSSG